MTAIERTTDADLRAERAQLAYALGPDVYQKYLQDASDAAKKRIEDRYAELNGQLGAAATNAN